MQNCPIRMVNPQKKTCIACGNRCNSLKIAKLITIYNENVPAMPIKYNKPGASISTKMERPKSKANTATKTNIRRSSKGKSPYSSHFNNEAILSAAKIYELPPVKNSSKKLSAETYKETSDTKKSVYNTEEKILAVKAQVGYAIQLMKERKNECALQRLQLLMGDICQIS